MSKAKSTSERNQKILKELLKRPENKFCCDCKTTAHPRWTSWSLGIFVCIRCSGIHRSMGTHISKVRSVDLDSWSDEQINMMVRWGNRRANLYWEHQLPDNYVPDDSKMVNFIRTKYDLKKWVAPGGIPTDPSRLESTPVNAPPPAQDDHTPLAHVQQRLAADKRGLNGKPVPPAKAQSSQLIPDLLGGDVFVPKAQAQTTVQTQVASAPVTASAPAAKPPVANSGQTTDGRRQSAQTLLGLDFAQPKQSAAQIQQIQQAQAQAQAQNKVSEDSRPDLKKSILSLYATNQTPVAQTIQQQQAAYMQQQMLLQQQQQQQQQNQSANMSNMSINHPAVTNNGTNSVNNGMSNAFADLSISHTSTSTSSHGRGSSGSGSLFDSLVSGVVGGGNTSPSSQNPSVFWAQQTGGAPLSPTGVSSATTATSTFGSNNEWTSFAASPAPIAKNVAPSYAATTSVPRVVSRANSIDNDLFNNVWK